MQERREIKMHKKFKLNAFSVNRAKERTSKEEEKLFTYIYNGYFVTDQADGLKQHCYVSVGQVENHIFKKNELTSIKVAVDFFLFLFKSGSLIFFSYLQSTYCGT